MSEKGIVLAVKRTIFGFGFWKKRMTIKALRFLIACCDAVRGWLTRNLFFLEPPEQITRIPRYRGRTNRRIPRRNMLSDYEDEDDEETT